MFRGQFVQAARVNMFIVAANFQVSQSVKNNVPCFFAKTSLERH